MEDVLEQVLKAKAALIKQGGDQHLELIVAPDVCQKLLALDTRVKPTAFVYDMRLYVVPELEAGTMGVVPAGTDHKVAARILNHRAAKARKQKIKPGPIKGEHKIWPPDDGKRDLLEDEFYDRMIRVSGEVECEHCGFIYYDHPLETRQAAGCQLHRLCNGWFGKT